VGKQRGAAVVQTQVGDSDHSVSLLLLLFDMVKIVRVSYYHRNRKKDSTFLKKYRSKIGAVFKSTISYTNLEVATFTPGPMVEVRVMLFK
jgi:hypothetical protein